MPKRSKKARKSSKPKQTKLIRRPNDPIVTELEAVRNTVNSTAANTAAATEVAAKAARAELRETIGRIFKIVFAITIIAAPVVFLGTLSANGNLQTAGMAVLLFLWCLFVCHILYSMRDSFERKVVETYLAACDYLRVEYRRLWY
jgi:hypothetical protein